ncbi:hypothetical protein K4G61_g5562, partial [Candida parapsilosis]
KKEEIEQGDATEAEKEAQLKELDAELTDSTPQDLPNESNKVETK